MKALARCRYLDIGPASRTVRNSSLFPASYSVSGILSQLNAV